MDHYDRLSSLIDMSISPVKQNLSHYTLNYLFKTTFVRLRYSLGGHRPSETAKLKMSLKNLVPNV